jgi:hypothetical protein
MIVDGVEYLRDYKGFWRCPFPECHHPDYPARKFKTDAGFIKHLGECKARPDGSGVWQKPPEPPKTVWGVCPDCQKPILSGETVWWMVDKKVCMGCYEPYLAADVGHMDCCDLVLPGVTLEG